MDSDICRGRRDDWSPSVAGSGAHRARPVPGDVVIGPVAGRPGRFGLRQLPHDYEVVGATLSDCVSTGRRFATANRVDIWSVDAHGRSTLIERNRLGHPREGA